MARDVKMMHIDSDIQKIQIKTNLYLKSYGPAGCMHLVKEAIQNAVDEVVDPESGGSVIYVTYDMLEDSITVEDDGRGFPEKDYPLDIFCTKIQSGSKFMRDSNTRSAGEFGLGLTAVCALSLEFILASYRENENYCHRLVFKNGEKVEDIKEPLEKRGKKHGSYIKFIPSKKYLGPTARIIHEDLEETIDDISYQLTDDVVIYYTLRSGLDVVKKIDYKKKDPIHLLDKICADDFIIKPFLIASSSDFSESVINLNPDIKDEMVSKNRSAEYAVMIAYDSNPDTVYDSYCNFANTTGGGVHVEAAESAFCRFIQSKTKESLTDREKDKLDITWSDVRTNLKMVVTLSTNGNVEFVGNAKDKIGSPNILKVMREGLSMAIPQYFEENPGKLKNIMQAVKTNAKVRIEANKIREASTKEVMTSLKEHQESGFMRCSNTGKGTYKEIFFFEGKSPQGGAGNARDTHTQALLCFRGVGANPYKSTLAELMHPQTGNVEYKRMVRVLRCGVGPSFKLENLYYDKIILFSDADIDGLIISASWAGFFIKHMPEIVEAGKLYRVLPPLYKLDDKSHPYVRTKKEMVEVYRDKIVKNYKLMIVKYSTEKPIGKEEFYEFIEETSEYLKNLDLVATHFGINKFLIEKLIAFIVYKAGSDRHGIDIHALFDSQEFVSELMSYIQEDFPEIALTGSGDVKTLTGVVDGKYQSLMIGKRLLRKCEALIPTLDRYGYSLIVKEKDGEFLQMSIGKFLESAQRYVPKILVRFKGIGEMSAEDLMATTMDPNTRMLLRLTMNDLKRDIEIFEKLFGNSSKNAAERKKMMEEFVIDRDDLDN